MCVGVNQLLPPVSYIFVQVSLYEALEGQVKAYL